MLRIGIELNDVVRNINRQYLKYYQKAIDQSFDIDSIDEKKDVLSMLKFSGQNEKDEFIYTEYPYEIFGCADSMEKNLAAGMRAWTERLSDIEDDDVRLSFYSLEEGGLTIQATYFFLSKLGTRARKVFFPIKIDEVWEECDVVITANEKLFDNVPEGKKIVLINREKNSKFRDRAQLNYDSLVELMNDNMFFSKITNGKINDINEY
jgi:hypothetical protein